MNKEELLPHQERAIERLKQPDQRGLILMHGLGSGKTRSSIEAYKQLGLPAEVVLPAALKENYVKELKKWLGKVPKDMSLKSQQLLARKGANPEDFENKLLIVDEAHRMRNADTKLFRALKEISPQKRLLLTGTPIYNHPADIAKLINVAAGKNVLPEARPDFEKRYIEQTTVYPSSIDRVLGTRGGLKLGVKNKEELRRIFNKMIDYHGGSSEGFPEMTHENIKVPMDREQQMVYDALMKKLPWHLRLKVRAGLPPGKKELDKLVPFLSGARMISNSSKGFVPEELAKSPKIEVAAEYLKSRIGEDPSYKALVYSNYLDNGVNPYKQKLDAAGIPYGEFTGDINDRLRNELVKKYNENKLKALIISSAGGEGLDLKGTRLVQVLEPHFNNEKLKQVVGRAARYLSHSDLPKEKQNVLVQNYLSTLTPSLSDKFLRKKLTSSDEYLQGLSDQKEQLNNAFIDLIKHSSVVKTAKSLELLQLLEAKKKSDARDYISKNHIIQKLTHANPDNFKIDSRLNKSYVGLTHVPTGFKIHAPIKILPGALTYKKLD
jgi:SNF2 family DNA or RNA helicase